MLYSIIVGLIVIICILLTIIILLQSGQGQGLAGGLAASSGFGGTPMGARRTADILSKSTTILGSSFLVLCVLANFFIYSEQPDQSAVQQSAGPQPTSTDAPSQSAPAVPQQQQQQPQQNNQQVPAIPQQQQPTGQQPANPGGGGNNTGGGGGNSPGP